MVFLIMTPCNLVCGNHLPEDAMSSPINTIRIPHLRDNLKSQSSRAVVIRMINKLYIFVIRMINILYIFRSLVCILLKYLCEHI
jgi:hypothetical protein